MYIQDIFSKFMKQYDIEIRGSSTGLAIWKNREGQEVFRVRYTEFPFASDVVIYNISLTPLAKGKKITTKLVRYLKDCEIDFRIEDVDNKGLYGVCIKQGLTLIKPETKEGTRLVVGYDKEFFGSFEYKGGK